MMTDSAKYSDQRGSIMTLTTDFMGLKLKNPIIIAAGPWSRNGDMVRRAFQAGAGAVVTKDVEDNAVVVGVPGKIIKYNESKI